MAKKKAIQKSNDFGAISSSLISGVISFFMLSIVAVLPLLFDDSYFNILETKYKWFYMNILAMIVVLFILSLVLFIFDFKQYKGVHTIALFSKLKPQNWKKTFHAADVAVLIFWVVCLISTLQSDYPYEALWGNAGRYSGLFLITLYVAVYFIVSRFWIIKGWLIQAFLVAGLVVCFIGITDYFKMDILGFQSLLSTQDMTRFTSTIGNINTYTAYVALIMGVSCAMFATTNELAKSIWYYFCMVISFFAIILGRSDNAYLAMGALFIFLPFLLFQRKEGVIRYIVILATFTSVVQCIIFINQTFSDTVMGLGLFNVLSNFKGLIFVVLGLWILAVGLWQFWRKNPAQKELGNRLLYIWGGFIALCILAVCFILFDANVLGHEERYSALSTYLVFNNYWGTYRGYTWRKSLEIYGGFTGLHRIFGYGLDTFALLTSGDMYEQMVLFTGEAFDNAHNEYLQYLVTIGPIGLISYVVFLGSSIWRMVKNRLQSPYVIGCMFAVLCYAVQAVVNLNLPIATPLMWVLLAMGMARCIT